MTSTMVSGRDPRWGESREAARAARRRKRSTVLLTAWGGILLIGALLSGFGGDLGLPGPHAFSRIAIVLIFLIGGVLIWRNWRETDEMQRRLAIQTWAVIGLTNFLLVPTFNVLSEWTGDFEWNSHVWKISVATGLIYYLIQRVRP
ncbi:MAG: hypothetical protein ACTMKV_02475 [Sphingomonas parapaucimobilis]